MQPQSALRATRSKEEMLELIAKHDKGATTVKEFCQQNGLTQGVFYYWQKKYHIENSQPVSQSGFVQLQLEDTPQVGTHQGLFAEVRGIKLYQTVPAAYLNELASIVYVKP
jgi:Transposase